MVLRLVREAGVRSTKNGVQNGLQMYVNRRMGIYACVCGKEWLVETRKVLDGSITSCGCKRTHQAVINTRSWLRIHALSVWRYDPYEI